MENPNKKKFMSVAICIVCVIAGVGMHISQGFFESNKSQENPYAKEFIFKGPKVLGAKDDKKDSENEENSEESVQNTKEVKFSDLPEIDF